MVNYASSRKMKRTKREVLRQVESENRDVLQGFIPQYNKLIAEFIKLQKNFLAITNILKGRGIVDDFSIHQELQKIEEMEVLQKKALIIDPNKPQVTL